LLGPAIGGFLTDYVSWRWVFYVNFPLCVLNIVLIIWLEALLSRAGATATFRRSLQSLVHRSQKASPEDWPEGRGDHDHVSEK
jgi:MFS family permease